METFLEIPHPLLGNWSPCPYLKQARLNNKIYIDFIEVENIYQASLNHLHLLENKEAVVLCFDHTKISFDTLETITDDINFAININIDPRKYICLHNHPLHPEFVDQIQTNFTHSGLIILQDFIKLVSAGQKLKEKGYFKYWDEKAYKKVGWRFND